VLPVMVVLTVDDQGADGWRGGSGQDGQRGGQKGGLEEPHAGYCSAAQPHDFAALAQPGTFSPKGVSIPLQGRIFPDSLKSGGM